MVSLFWSWSYVRMMKPDRSLKYYGRKRNDAIFWRRLSNCMAYLNRYVYGNKYRFMILLSLLVLAGCSSSVWNNPHGLLGGLFSSSPSTAQSSGGNSSSTGGTPKQVPSSGSLPSSSGGETPSDLGRSLSPPEFVHAVPFEEGDGVYVQWSMVPGATDYFLYKNGRLVVDTPSTIYRLYGLLPCHHYHLSLWSSDSVRLSKTALSFVVHTRGCASPPPRE